MERLTEKIQDGILVKECYGKGALQTLYACYEAKPDMHYGNCDEGYCAMEKLVEYEDLEEQGKLLKLPCMVGDMVYAHCSEFGILTYTVDCIVINENVTFQCSSYSEIECLDQIEPNILEFGKTVFLTKEEAEIEVGLVN